MITIIRMLFLYGIILFAASCCEKDDKVNNKKSLQINKEIIGDWINTINIKDTLFINDKLIRRSDTLSCEPDHLYDYTILSSDSIKIQYKGRYEIYCPEKTFHISLDKQEMILTIGNLNNYFPRYPGDTFKKLTNK
jgi:hypothetical protein